MHLWARSAVQISREKKVRGLGNAEEPQNTLCLGVLGGRHGFKHQGSGQVGQVNVLLTSWKSPHRASVREHWRIETVFSRAMNRTANRPTVSLGTTKQDYENLGLWPLRTFGNSVRLHSSSQKEHVQANCHRLLSFFLS